MQHTSTKAVSIETAFKYPFNRPKGMLNILWALIPIFGWFAIGGYGVRITREFVQGKFEQLPTFSFKSDMELGFWIFLKSLPMVIGSFILLFLIVLSDPFFIGPFLNALFSLVVFPILLINLIVHGTVESSFDFSVVKPVFLNFGEYCAMLIKSVFLGFVFLLLSLLLVGIPANVFTQNLFIADFYRRFIYKQDAPSVVK